MLLGGQRDEGGMATSSPVDRNGRAARRKMSSHCQSDIHESARTCGR